MQLNKIVLVNLQISLEYVAVGFLAGENDKNVENRLQRKSAQSIMLYSKCRGNLGLNGARRLHDPECVITKDDSGCAITPLPLRFYFANLIILSAINSLHNPLF